MIDFPAYLTTDMGVEARRLSSDSRDLRPGDIFIAYPGGQVDGRRYIAQAIEQGASAVIWEASGFTWDDAWQVPNHAVYGLREKAGLLADRICGFPSRKLWMVGITGTNGKTSCSHWLAQAFGALGRKAAMLGTLGNGFPGELMPTANTTPDAVKVHGLLTQFVGKGAEVVAMEVSSHALAQGRVNGVKYDVALLTNLSRDHLDYHGDMQTYAAAKRRLFDWSGLKFAVVNLNDPFGGELAEQLKDTGPEVVGYGIGEEALQRAERLGIRMVGAVDLKVSNDGMGFAIRSSWGSARLHSALLGRFNALNLLGALTTLLVSGVSMDDAVREMSAVAPVAGRMQRLGGDGKPSVVVDYAHTPDALDKVLEALREVTDAQGGKLYCVFGCGGNRDRGKRPMMGTVADKLADWSIVTSDNPRNEAPQSIIEEIERGMRGNKHEAVVDRAEAIRRAIRKAGVNDTVLIAGKGHEQYQEIAGVKQPFSDAEVAQAILQELETVA